MSGKFFIGSQRARVCFMALTLAAALPAACTSDLTGAGGDSFSGAYSAGSPAGGAQPSGSAGANAGGVASGGSGANRGGASGTAASGAPSAAGSPVSDAGVDSSSGASSGSAGETGVAGAGPTSEAGAAGAGGEAPTCAPLTEAPDPTPATPCGDALCGNAQLDTCRDGDDHEPCDGNQLNGSSCASLGYVSGTLSCTAQCFFARSGCSDCAPSTQALACAHPVAGPSSPVSVDLARNSAGTELGLAWVTAAGALHFARVGLDLRVLAESTCLPAQGVNGASVISTSAGWLLGVTRDGFENLTLLALDEVGNLRSRRDLDGFDAPTFIERTGGGPLLTYLKYQAGAYTSELWAELLDANGALAQPAFKVSDNADALSLPSGAFLGDGFMLALPHSPYDPNASFDLLRISLGGQISQLNSIPFAAPAAHGMSWDGQTVRLLRTGNQTDDAGTAHHSFFEQFDKNGTRLAPAVPLPDSDSAYWGPAVGFGTDLVALVTLGVGAVPQQVSLARLDGKGNVTLAPVLLNQAPELIEHAIARVGADVYVAALSRDGESTFVASSTYSRITLEHVHPQ